MAASRVVFIGHVDSGLEKLVRTRLPLPEDVGDVSFERPSTTWAAQLSRLTVNLFLYDVRRSAQTSRAPVARPVADGGAPQRRRPQPMMELGYLVSAWAGSPRDEHLLLGEVVSMLAGVDVLPTELFSTDLGSSVVLTLGDERTSPRELWTAAGGTLKPAVQARVTVAADTFEWQAAPPQVTRISVLADRMPDEAADAASGAKPQGGRDRGSSARLLPS